MKKVFIVLIFLFSTAFLYAEDKNFMVGYYHNTAAYDNFDNEDHETELLSFGLNYSSPYLLGLLAETQSIFAFGYKIIDPLWINFDLGFNIFDQFDSDQRVIILTAGIGPRIDLFNSSSSNIYTQVFFHFTDIIDLSDEDESEYYDEGYNDDNFIIISPKISLCYEYLFSQTLGVGLGISAAAFGVKQESKKINEMDYVFTRIGLSININYYF